MIASSNAFWTISPRQASAPSTGSTVGACQCSCSTRSRRRISTAMLTETKTPSRSSTVVSASDSRSPTAHSASASAATKMIATHGVRRSPCTRPIGCGTIPCCAIP